jgi:hypothetical protein
MASLKTFFRANTDTISTLVQSNGSVNVGTPLFTKTLRVSAAAATPVTDPTTNIISGDGLDVLIAAIGAAQVPAVTTGAAYILIQVVAKGSALSSTQGATVKVKNLSTEAAAENNTISHALVNVGDSVLIPWRVDSTDTDIDKCPTVDATLNTTPAGADKYVDLAVSVFYA